MTERAILPTPPRLVENGQPHCGFFKTPFRIANILDTARPGTLFPGTLGRWFRLLRLKSWIGFGLGHPEIYGAILIQNAHYLAGCGAYFYNLSSRSKYDWSILAPPWKVAMPETLWNGRLECADRKSRVIFEHRLDEGWHRVTASFLARGETPSLEMDLILHQPLNEIDPLVFSMPIPPAHHTYTHKSPIRLEGIVRVGNTEYTYDPKRDLGNLDEQQTYYPYLTRWRWASFSSRLASGQELMINLVNQMTPPDEPGEDALWVDGRIRLLRPARIEPGDRPGNYRIQSPDGTISLGFTAEGARHERHQLLWAAMDYYQYFGRFSGHVTDPENGQVYTITDVYGPLEDMRARF
ncbi:MAG TPA: DUF2804 domain-containing protein [Candidatus Hydrogenedentes bacterium]|nr:DUF2804 domain-containing protein [Candidatus Hydrogenedentota bacterium]